MFTLETPRLLLREMTTTDAQFAFELNIDPEVLRFTGDESFLSVEEAANFLSAYDHYQKFGYGRWLVVLKETDESIGWCGLKNQLEDLGMIDLGYRFMKKYWGQGYATEAATACLDWGFRVAEMNEIIGKVAIGNDASDRVLEKLGFVFDQMDECEHHPARWYKLRSEQWKLRTLNDSRI